MKFKRIIPLILLCALLSGCWDKIEINRKAFVSIIAIDLGENIEKQDEFSKVKPNDTISEEDFKKLNVNFGFPDISELGPQKAGTANEQFVKVKAFSMQDAITELSAKTSRSVHTGHASLLIFSNEVLNYPETVKELLDYFNRQPNINRTMKVVISDGKAENFLKAVPILEKNVDAYITGVMENNSKNSSIQPTTLNEVLISLFEGGSAAIPTIEFSKEKDKEILFSGLSLVKNYKQVGNLKMEDMTPLQILKGNVKGGKDTIFKDGHPVEFEIRGIKRNLKLIEDKDPNKLKFKIDVQLEGQIKGYYIEKNIFSKNELEQIQDNLNDVLEKKCERVARITQEEYGIDVIGIRKYLEKFRPELFNKVKDNWGEVYKSAEIDVSISTKARRIGVTK